VVLVNELQLPSSLELPLYERVVLGAAPEIAITIVVALVAEVAVSLASRRLLAWRYGVAPDRVAGGEIRQALAGALRIVRHPVRTALNAGLTWSITLVTLLAALFALALAWGSVRDVLVVGNRQSDWLIAVAVAVGLFAAVWVGAIVFAALGSALRAAVWTVDALR
jgi:hypothetical protein